jgi:glutathione S-transferase
MKYLCNKYPQYVGDWYPANDYVKRAKIDEYLDFHHTNTRKCALYIFNTLFAKNMGVPTDPQFVKEAAWKDIQRALRLVSNFYLADNKYITGDKPTLADLSAYYEIQFLMLVG